MFEHLDDANPSDGRDRYGDVLRTARRRKRGWYAAGGSSALVVAGVVVLLVALLQPSGHASSRLITAPSPTPTPTQTPSVAVTLPTLPTPMRTPSPRSSSKPSHHVMPTPSRSSRPSPSPTCTTFRGDCPDGREGWGTGFTGCDYPAKAWVSTPPSQQGMQIALSAPSTGQGGQDLSGTLTVTNKGTAPFTYQRAVVFRAQVHDSHGRVVSGQYYTDAIDGGATVTLQPGDSESFRVSIPLHTCGDTSETAVPFAAGTYDVFAALGWSPGSGSGSPDTNKYWVGGPASVAVTG